MQRTTVDFLMSARDDGRRTFVQLRLRGTDAVCGPYTDTRARKRAASFYHDIPGVVSVQATTNPTIVADDAGHEWVVRAIHRDGRRAVIGPFTTPEAANESLTGFAAGLGDEFDGWRAEITGASSVYAAVA